MFFREGFCSKTGKWLASAALALSSAAAHASLTVLVGEPFGNFGTMMPVGHTAIYLDRVCADGPLKLRMCRPGEPRGVVVARYHRIGDIDWIATPVMQFLYAVDRPEDVPEYITPELAWSLRQRYRQRYMEAIVPDGTEKDKVTDEWWETAGVAYNRRLWGYQVDTTPEQDQAFIATMNARPNHHLYHLRKTNCANFAADMVNLYFPGTVTRGDHIADFGLMTPKQVARCLYAYGTSHPAARLKVVEVPQVAGSLRRSRPVRGAAEAGLKTKRYLFTLLVIQPEIPVGLAILYLDHGRWQMDQHAQIAAPDTFYNLPAATAGFQLPAGSGTPETSALDAMQSLSYER
jgi:hypothetical protein